MNSSMLFEDATKELVLQGGPERSRQSNLAVFTVEGGLDSKFACVM